ncbi:alpha/beta hydrolase-fold protein [Lentzea californiensis]|uniref:alpha/beta hydrolase-fold protein n=1 Tax=Lentzea californiensis TaxID=438851 RepID=UPI002165F5DC|nr:alpha/beta hydrolase-fold protein [Lentzea californiensis]MCR3753928.1 putative esterase [Lentzea californiensis]
MLPWEGPLAGRLDRHTVDSVLLRDNPLGDPHERPLWVYVPPGYDSGTEHYPTVYVIQGYTGHVAMWANRMPFRQPFIETADAVFAQGAPGCIVVYVDAWTSYGGSQFVDSPGTGRYHSYLCDEVVPWVDAHYRTIPDRESRAIAGKSSGGFGAMITPMLRPDLFGALATHAGDALYELCYLADFGKAARALRGYDHDVQKWWTDFTSRTAFTKPEDMDLLGILGVAACFSAREDGTPELPFDPVTGAPVPQVWQRWLDWDPVRMVAGRADAIRSLRAVWIDAGKRDEYFLDLGAEAFRKEIAAAGIPDERVHFELFDAGHGAIDYRYPLSLSWLATRLAR